ncbi:hypothetical protein D9619_002114 [Psilocybe cf. subviscida]|uniref:BTB domain-containing protein n=1 Tax=Psilocybe cf. subviscida TaxID=2480587 RepID=A0A8H5BEB2_9AGAR|nr:hypothetical protein D9619_002114 [Psilocybe cf. subviscida]
MSGSFDDQVPPYGEGTEKEPTVESSGLKPGPDKRDVEHPAAAILDPFFNFELVVFKVENTLFRVPKLAFLNSSEPENPFLNIFSLPPPDPKNVEGASLENPIVLENESSTDFRAFLHALYPW